MCDVVYRTARSQGARKRMGYDERYVFEEYCSKSIVQKLLNPWDQGLKETGITVQQIVLWGGGSEGTCPKL